MLTKAMKVRNLIPWLIRFFDLKYLEKCCEECYKRPPFTCKWRYTSEVKVKKGDETKILKRKINDEENKKNKKQKIKLELKSEKSKKEKKEKRKNIKVELENMEK